MTALIKTIGFGILVSLLIPQAHAFTLSGTDPDVKGWANHTVSFKLNTANCPANIDTVIEDAMRVWNAVPSTDLIVEQRGLTTTTETQLSAGTATDVPVIICDTAFSAHSGAGGNNIPGVARVATPAPGGNMSYGYLLINVEPGSTGNISTLNATTVSIVLAHEIGHVLGLGHSPDVNALMYFDASAKLNLSLGRDDIDGISYLYPRNELNGKAFGCAMTGEIGGGGPWTYWKLVALALLLGLPLSVVVGLKKLTKVRS